MFLNWFPKGGVFLCWPKGRDNHVFRRTVAHFFKALFVVHNRMNADLHIFPFDCSIASSLKSPKRLDCLNHWDREAVWYKFDEWKILNN